MNESKFIFFWGGPFSQWYKCKLIIDEVEYNCAEQYMMAMKAIYFGDTLAHIKIMDTKNPRLQQEIGRTVKNFDSDKWNQIVRHFVYRATLVKFCDPQLRKILLATDNKEIVEASPFDCIWGIGLAQEDPARFDTSQWRGTNWLGQILMEVRDQIKKAR